jgi:hypothetical protein
MRLSTSTNIMVFDKGANYAVRFQDSVGVCAEAFGGAEERERVERDEACHELVQALVDARLLVTSRSASDQALVEVAHEALFRSWPNLKAWIEEAQDDLILLRQVRSSSSSIRAGLQGLPPTGQRVLKITSLLFLLLSCSLYLRYSASS